jgi:hypothetical protein
MLLDAWQHLWDLLMWVGLRPPISAATGDGGGSGETNGTWDPNG